MAFPEKRDASPLQVMTFLDLSSFEAKQLNRDLKGSKIQIVVRPTVRFRESLMNQPDLVIIDHHYLSPEIRTSLLRRKVAVWVHSPISISLPPSWRRIWSYDRSFLKNELKAFAQGYTPQRPSKQVLNPQRPRENPFILFRGDPSQSSLEFIPLANSQSLSASRFWTNIHIPSPQSDWGLHHHLMTTQEWLIALKHQLGCENIMIASLRELYAHSVSSQLYFPLVDAAQSLPFRFERGCARASLPGLEKLISTLSTPLISNPSEIAELYSLPLPLPQAINPWSENTIHHLHYILLRNYRNVVYGVMVILWGRPPTDAETKRVQELPIFLKAVQRSLSSAEFLSRIHRRIVWDRRDHRCRLDLDATLDFPQFPTQPVPIRLADLSQSGVKLELPGLLNPNRLGTTDFQVGSQAELLIRSMEHPDFAIDGRFELRWTKNHSWGLHFKALAPHSQKLVGDLISELRIREILHRS